MGWLGIFDFFFFFFEWLGCLEVGGFYGLIWPVVERLGIADSSCAGMLVVMVLAQLGLHDM
jgi:hypothetical protein